jgi:hypothetical protein
MAEFYVETLTQSNGDHLVHKSTCSLLPSKESILYVGSVSNAASAIKKANQTFPRVTGCSQCAST